MSGGDKKDNLFSIEDSHSVEDLVRHMRRLRDSIPVNRSLRAELRARLIEGRQGDAQAAVSAGPRKAAASPGPKMRWWAAGAFLAVLLLAVHLAVFKGGGEKLLEAGPMTELARFWVQEQPLAPAVSPADGLIAVERGGALLLLNRQGSRFATVRPPGGEKYSAPAWSHDGGRLALVREKESGSEITVLEVPAGTSPGDLPRVIGQGSQRAGVLASYPAGSSLSDLAWSPDGGTVAYTLREGGQSQVFLAGPGRSPVLLGQGARAAWSPDGKWLVMEREGREESTLWLLSREEGRQIHLGNGRFPVWNQDGYLIFVQAGMLEKILSYLPDGIPQFKVQRKTAEVRWFKPDTALPDGGLSGSRLLWAQDSPTGPEELQWLKSLELSGVRDPRTLFLDRAGDIQGLFAGDGRSLYLSRRDGGTVAMTRMELVEKAATREGSER